MSLLNWLAGRFRTRERDGRPPMLFLSPVMPAADGTGLALRALATLAALAADYDVHLQVIGTAAGPPGEQVRRWCARVLTHPAGSGPVPGIAEHAAGPRYAAVHVLRLDLAPFAEPYLSAQVPHRPVCHLDLDDHEAATRRRIARLLRDNGDERGALAHEREASRYETLGAALVPRFDRVYLATAADRDLAAAAYPGVDVAVLEQVARPLRPLAPPPDGEPFTFLFAGDLGYYPDEDAIRYFCAEVLPRLRASAPGPFRVRLTGGGSQAVMGKLRGEPEVSVTGPAIDVTPWYEAAHAVIVPVRAGGGAPVKVLEAFAHQRPVVATPAGAQGLELTPGRHLLVAGSPAEFAACCARLMRDPVLARTLTGHSTAFILQRGPERVRLAV